MLPFARPGARVAATLAALLVSVLGVGPAAATPSQAPAPAPLPSPLRFVSSLDLECFPTAVHQPPFSGTIVTRHLNPVLAHLPAELTPLGGRLELCVPVAKNNVQLPPEVLRFIQWVDLACYRTTGQDVSFPLGLRHLNPLFANLPPHGVRILSPVQLCVPVMKNGLVPPPEVLRLVSFIDLKCYREAPATPLNTFVRLTQLNPVLTNLPPAVAAVFDNHQLCVPVRKNNQPIPDDVLNIVRWIDLEKYNIVTTPLAAPVTLRLNHLNPLLAALPAETVTITEGKQLMLPVAKNNVIPPPA